MTNAYATEIWPLAVYFLMVILLVITMLVLSWLLGQRRREAATNDPFESDFSAFLRELKSVISRYS